MPCFPLVLQNRAGVLSRACCLLLIFLKCPQTSTRSMLVPWFCCVHAMGLWTSRKNKNLGLVLGIGKGAVVLCTAAESKGGPQCWSGQCWWHGDPALEDSVDASVILAALASACAGSFLVHVFHYCSHSLLFEAPFFFLGSNPFYFAKLLWTELACAAYCMWPKNLL